MNETMDTILVEALDLLEQGLGVDEITARYPAQAAELRPFLLTAVALSRLATQPAAAAEARSKRAFLAAAAAPPARSRGVAGLWRRLALPVAALVAVLFLGAAGLVGASASAVPGDALYEAKLFVEEARLGLAADPEQAATLREQFRLERAREVAQLLAAERQADVTLTGPIEEMSGARWTVAGVPVAIMPDTVIDGAPAIGAEAQIDGRTGQGVVEAARVTILVGAIPQLPPPAEPTADLGTPEARPVTGDETPTRPAASSTATTATSEPAATPSTTAAPTPTGEATPSATPGDDNANDNGDNANDNDDNANDNGDDNANDNDDNANDNGDNANDNDDNANDNDDNANDNGDNANDNGDNANDNGDNANDNDDNANDNGDNANDNGDNSGSGGGDNANDNGDDNGDNSGSGGGDNGNDNSGGGDDQNN